MLNYIKSELYRTVRSREIRETACVFVGLVLLLNVVLYLFKDQEHFRYGITSFSYSNLVSLPMIYCYVAADVAAMLYEADKRNGTMGNAISGGISRLELFTGKCIVTLITSLCLLALILPVYIGSAALLLNHAGPTTVKDLLLEIPAVSLIAIAALISAVVLLELFDKTFLSILAWLGIWVIFPKVLMLAGMALEAKTEFLLDISLWMPENFFTVMMRVNMSECSTIWSTAPGMARCLLSGAVGILVFAGAGVLLLRKQEF